MKNSYIISKKTNQKKLIIRYISLVFSFVLLLVSIESFSQKTWSLQECVEYAQTHSISLQQQELNIESQQINLSQSKANMLPTLNGMGSYGLNWGKSVDRFTNQFADTRTSSINLYLQTEVTVFNGFRLLNTIKKNQFELSAGKYDMDYSRDMKSMEVTTAYLQVLYAEENVKNKRESVKNSELQVDRMQKMADAGRISQGDLLTIKAQYAAEQSQLVKAESSLNMAYLTLMQLMDLPSDTTFFIQQPVIELNKGFGQLLEARMVYDFAIQNRPEIKSAEMKLNSSQTDLSIARSGYYPRLSLSAGYGSGYSGANSIVDGNPSLKGFLPNGDITSGGDTVYSPIFDYNFVTKAFNDQMLDNKNYSVGINLTIPIFNNFQTINNVKQSKLAIQQAELRLEQQKNELRKSIEQAYADASSAAKAYQAADAQYKALNESYLYASQKFEAGMLNSYEYNDAKIKMESAKSDLLNAKYDYVFRVKILDFYFGRPLSL